MPLSAFFAIRPCYTDSPGIPGERWNADAVKSVNSATRAAVDCAVAQIQDFHVVVCRQLVATPRAGVTLGEQFRRSSVSCYVPGVPPR